MRIMDSERFSDLLRVAVVVEVGGILSLQGYHVQLCRLYTA